MWEPMDEAEESRVAVAPPPRVCPTCQSKGFAVSVLGPQYCEFCDGTEGGNPQTATERLGAAPTRKVNGRPALDLPVRATPPPPVLYDTHGLDFSAVDVRPTIHIGEAPALPTPPAPRPLVFDAVQESAITACDTTLFTNISGTAGVGKSEVAKAILMRHAGVVLAATTGIASVNLGEGTTINALLRYFNTRDLVSKYTDGILQATLRKLRRIGVQRILIDEKSMLAGQQLTPLVRAVREVNEGGIYKLDEAYQALADEEELPSDQRDLPPIGITLVGDFGQLPPVPDEEEVRDATTGETKLRKLPVSFAFESPEWPLFADHTTRLETIYRQDAKDFVAALHAIRAGLIVPALQFFDASRFSDTQDDHFDGTTIFAKNDAVERYNQLRLDALAGSPMTMRAVRVGKQRGDWAPKNIPDQLTLKEGALVMVLANKREYEDDHDDRGTLVYTNGDLGTLRGVKGVGWVVTLQRTGQEVVVTPVRRENTIPLEPGRRKELRAAFEAGTGPDPQEVITEKGKGKNEIVGTITYMPLRAAWGCTVHKTQGLTLDRVQVNLRDYFFAQPGMLFVALSRCRTAEGLRIVGNQKGFTERVRIEPRVQAWL